MIRHAPNRGSVLLEVVLALGLFASCAMIVSGVLVRTGSTVDTGRLEAEANDLVDSTLSLIQSGLITPEAADRLSREEVLSLLDDRYEPGEPSMEIVIETEPTAWRSVSLVRITAVRPDSESPLAESFGLVDLDRVRSLERSPFELSNTAARLEGGAG